MSRAFDEAAFSGCIEAAVTYSHLDSFSIEVHDYTCDVTGEAAWECVLERIYADGERQAVAVSDGFGSYLDALLWAHKFGVPVLTTARVRQAVVEPAPMCEAQRLCERNQRYGMVALPDWPLERRVSEDGTRFDYTLPDGSVYIVSRGKHSTCAFWDQGSAK